MKPKRKRLFHVSPDDLGEKVLFHPRIPSNRFEGGELYHPYMGETIKEENDTIKRICVSNSIRGCFRAVPIENTKTCYVYIPLTPLVVSRDLPLCLVPDAKETGEHWILNKTWMIREGEIEILESDGFEVVKYKWTKRIKKT